MEVFGKFMSMMVLNLALITSVNVVQSRELPVANSFEELDRMEAELNAQRSGIETGNGGESSENVPEVESVLTAIQPKEDEYLYVVEPSGLQ